MPKYALRVVREGPKNGEAILSYTNSIITRDSALDVYRELDAIEKAPLIVPIDDEESLDDFLTRIRRRKVKCGKYLLNRDIYLVMEEIPEGLGEKWRRMVEDDVFILPK